MNRLDRLTSGLMILALTGKASSLLAREFMEGRVRKEYRGGAGSGGVDWRSADEL